ncbi:MAG: DUF4926 domain-containing protein [Dehalococcoidia bacterium]
MNYHATDCVVLKQDLPEHGLRTGDIGTVVETYDSEAIEVEFVAPTGEARALLTLNVNDVRAVSADDMLAVRPR